ncbi:hypothetical protein H7X65_02275 [Candidatus Parcubacteria bacterium]|nr:hypothetical protein [Candidatus Parcubacteria bacterium]
MKTKEKLNIITSVLLIGTLIFLGITWWVNGLDDTWFYAVCGIIVLTSFISIFSKRNKQINH